MDFPTHRAARSFRGAYLATSNCQRQELSAIWELLQLGHRYHLGKESVRQLREKASDALHIATVLIAEALDQVPLLRAGSQGQ